MYESFPVGGEASPDIRNSASAKILESELVTELDEFLGIELPFYKMKVLTYEQGKEGKVVSMKVLTPTGKKRVAARIAKAFKEKNAVAAKTGQNQWNYFFGIKHYTTQTFADLRHGYAVSTHKAQGSTFRNVYVMEDNIMGTADAKVPPIEKNRSMYVAVLLIIYLLMIKEVK